MRIYKNCKHCPAILFCCRTHEVFSAINSARFNTSINILYFVNMCRRLTDRVPKRICQPFFNEDKCTSILNASKVKRILTGESKIREGLSVEVEFDGANYVKHISSDCTVSSITYISTEQQTQGENQKFSYRRANSQTVATSRIAT